MDELLAQGYLKREGWDDFVQNQFELYYRFPEPDIGHFAFYATTNHQNSQRLLHGGVLSAYLDHCMGALSYWTCERQFAYTLQYSVQFVKASRVNRWIHCDTRVLAHSNNELLLQAAAYTGGLDGPLIATAQGSFGLSGRTARKNASSNNRT